jgi:hypothetical protein
MIRQRTLAPPRLDETKTTLNAEQFAFKCHFAQNLPRLSHRDEPPG